MLSDNFRTRLTGGAEPSAKIARIGTGNCRPMRACVTILMLLLLGSGMRAATAADGTWFVVPGKRGIPVIVNPLGFDASYMIVEGDFGLDRPGRRGRRAGGRDRQVA